MKAYPDLDIIAITDKSLPSKDEFYNQGIVDKSNVYITYIYRGKNGVYFKDDDSLTYIFSQEYVTVAEEKYNELFQKFCSHIVWEKVIVIYVDPYEGEDEIDR